MIILDISVSKLLSHIKFHKDDLNPQKLEGHFSMKMQMLTLVDVKTGP